MRALLLILTIVAIAAAPAAAQQKAAAKSAPAAKASAAPTAPVNLNTATQAQLVALPGVGVKAAQRVIDYRQKNGNFKKIEDLMNVKGFGEKTFLKLKPMLSVTQKSEPTGSGR